MCWTSFSLVYDPDLLAVCTNEAGVSSSSNAPFELGLHGQNETTSEEKRGFPGERRFGLALLCSGTTAGALGCLYGSAFPRQPGSLMTRILP